MKNKFSIAMSLAVILTLLMTSLALADGTPTISSDLPDYAPGETVNLFGAGWQVGESVHIFVNDNVGSSWSRNADVVAAADGTIMDTFQLPNWFVATYGVTATGAISGTVTTTFTDGNASSVSGQVLDNNNNPISGATVSCTSGCNASFVTTTNASGIYFFDGAAGHGAKLTFVGNGPTSLTLTASKAGYTSANQILSPVNNGNSFANVNFSLTLSDSTPPVITKIITGTVGTNGWYTSNVTVAWSVTDAESVVVIDSGCGTQSFTSETNSTTSSCTAHSAGGSASDSVTIKIDKTAPIGVSGAPNRAPDSGSWYNHAVNVVFTGSDATSGIASCTSTNYSGPDGSGVTVNGSCTDNAGNASAPVASSAFNYDGTAPTAVLSVTAGTAGLNGWYTSDVTVHTSGSDAVSGVTCTADQFQTTETAGTAYNGSCTNGAGLTTDAAPLTVKLDKTGPSAALAVTAGTAGANGWYTSDVTISTSGTDSISSPVSCTPNQFQTAETAGTAFNGSCTNDAGLTTNAAPLTVKLDKTGPSATLSAVGTLGNNGWYVSDVTIKTTGSDTISDPTACSADQSQTTDTTGATFNGSCTNDAGLTTNAAPLTIKRDATAPTLAPTVSPNPVILNASATASPNASDATSGLASSGCDAVNTSAAGTFTVNCSATDNAGNTATATASYTVSYKVCALYDQTKAHKSGSTVPVKLQLCDVNGVNYSSASIVVRAISVTKLDNTAGALDDSGSANSPDMNFRYDASLSGYIFNLSTKGLTTGTWKLTFTVDGQGSYFVKFDVK